MEEYKELVRCFFAQREQYAKRAKGEYSSMTDERITILEDIGFIWGRNEESWNIEFEELKEYIHDHGDCFVFKESSLDQET
eukprot:CAMPEP_0204652390 /NCGR_PEP_ID=MMETSP0718-20130828/14523_1 /ASSEMBLY_ACC=CAM_ASM_000674 /TAXON_ID=230516 /ORGANISM="Chaetoceros curvisetus" /LENGTH=80 /DNA_ID=CAMNT_0051676343 /DNA_START=630 /DNA_END=872 /DNA_ORIENTATION=-